MWTTVEAPSVPTLLRFAMVSGGPKGQAAARWILGAFFVDRVEGAVRRCLGDPGPGYGARGPGTGTGKKLSLSLSLSLELSLSLSLSFSPRLLMSWSVN